jgi:hypothetical protein
VISAVDSAPFWVRILVGGSGSLLRETVVGQNLGY